MTQIIFKIVMRNLTLHWELTKSSHLLHDLFLLNPQHYFSNLVSLLFHFITITSCESHHHLHMKQRTFFYTLSSYFSRIDELWSETTLNHFTYLIPPWDSVQDNAGQDLQDLLSTPQTHSFQIIFKMHLNVSSVFPITT